MHIYEVFVFMHVSSRFLGYEACYLYPGQHGNARRQDQAPTGPAHRYLGCLERGSLSANLEKQAGGTGGLLHRGDTFTRTANHMFFL